MAIQTNPLRKLRDYGQSAWIDNLSRPMLTEGRLKKLILMDGISGLTSNPVIFHKAMTQSAAYDKSIAEEARGKSTEEIYEALAVNDIRDAADELRPTFEQCKGADGFVSLEVSPHLADHTQRSISDGLRLWNRVDRPNLLMKVPGTQAGIPAIEALLVQGVNVNITLLFSISRYREVMEAYIAALEKRKEKGQPLSSVASVASFFLSRIDSKVDALLDQLSPEKNGDELRGKTAIANAKLAYQEWKSVFSGPRWQKLADAGARVQRPLWASTSTKDPRYPDTMYVDPLIGPESINTMPDETIDAFRDHGHVGATVEENLAESRNVMTKLRDLEIDLSKVTQELEQEGIEKFAKPYDALLQSLEEKRKSLRTP